jgi:hypothetical protein
MAPPDSSDTLPPYAQRVRIVRRHLLMRAMDSTALYERGGAHPKDLEVARTLHYIAALLASVFPELDD